MNKDKLVYEINNSNTKDLKLFIFRTLTNNEDEKQIPSGRFKRYMFEREIYKNDEVNQISKKEFYELKLLDHDTLNFAIARMEIIIESFKSIGSLALVMSFVIFFYTIYDRFLIEEIGMGLATVFMMVIAIVNIKILMHSLKKDRLNMLVATYVKSILEDVKTEKVNKQRNRRIYYQN